MRIFKKRLIAGSNKGPRLEDIVKESRENQQKIAEIKKRVGGDYDNIHHPVPFGVQISR